MTSPAQPRVSLLIAIYCALLVEACAIGLLMACVSPDEEVIVSKPVEEPQCPATACEQDHVST